MQKTKNITTDFSVEVSTKLIMVVRVATVIGLLKRQTHKTAEHTVPVLYFSGKLQQHRDHDDGKDVRQFLKRF